MFNINAELRFDVYKNFGVVVFSDWGALIQNSIQDYVAQGQRRTFGGSGAGIRYDTPIGPLRFDVGIKWHIQQPDFEARYSLCLGLGKAF